MPRPWYTRPWPWVDAAIARFQMRRSRRFNVAGIRYGDYLDLHERFFARPLRLTIDIDAANRAIAESRGDPWPPVHRKPLQHAPGCRDASCAGCR